MSEWQSIDTAPEYQDVLVYDPRFGRTGVFRAIRRDLNGPGAAWKDSPHQKMCLQPTHWMPIDPPVESGQTEPH
jgi:hypothetical protein